MALTLNKVTLIGRLGKDPEIRTMQDSKKLATFSVATSDSWVDKSTNERVEKTEWHNVVVFNENLVKIVENYLRKGGQIYIEGALKTRKWTDNSGNERYTTEIVLQFNSSLILLDKKSEVQPLQDSSPISKQNQEPQIREDEFIDDEIPF